MVKRIIAAMAVLYCRLQVVYRRDPQRLFGRAVHSRKAIAKKLLEKEGTRSLNEAVEIANAVLLIEAGSNGATASASASGVSHSEGTTNGTLARVTTVKCFRCNREGHRASDKEKCRAVTQTCNTCGQKGHFSGAKFCKQTKRSQGLSLIHI